jgi:hypothetical protein
VCDDKGGPVCGAVYFLFPCFNSNNADPLDNKYYAIAITDKCGVLAFGKVPPGDYTLQLAIPPCGYQKDNATDPYDKTQPNTAYAIDANNPCQILIDGQPIYCCRLTLVYDPSLTQCEPAPEIDVDNDVHYIPECNLLEGDPNGTILGGAAITIKWPNGCCQVIHSFCNGRFIVEVPPNVKLKNNDRIKLTQKGKCTECSPVKEKIIDNIP